MTPERLRWLLLGATALVSGILVVGAFNPAPHAGGDNAGYLSLGYALLTTGSYTELFDPARLPHMKYPPVFPALLAGLMWLGARTWTAFKMVAALSTVAAVGLTYLWAERRLGPWGAFAVALIMGASTAVVYYSHWVLSDPLFVAFTMAALFALDRDGGADVSPAWLTLGIVATALAYFTRSAGLPLVVALFGWMALRKKWLALGLTSVGLGLPALAWWARGLGAASSYSTEFWLVDPYQPALGRIEVWGLLPRAWSNLSAYVTGHLPSGVVGDAGAWVPVVGVLLTLLALYGWLRSLRRDLGPAEIFFPAYAALILVWPEVWAGDRFALPLYPLLLVWGGVAIRDVAARLPSAAGQLLVVAAILVLLLPAGSSWPGSVAEARSCARVIRSDGAFSCYGPRVSAFVFAAEWTGSAVPSEAAVLSRKPRHFFVASGIPSRTFPFHDDPGLHLEEADQTGARYVLLDQWDGLAARYVGAAVARQPGAFCFVRGFGEPGAPRAQLLGVLPPAQREAPPGQAPSGGVRLGVCPAEYTVTAQGAVYSSSPSTRIPLLDGLDP